MYISVQQKNEEFGIQGLHYARFSGVGGGAGIVNIAICGAGAVDFWRYSHSQDIPRSAESQV